MTSILIAEDNASVRYMYQNTLPQMYQGKIALNIVDNGQSAINHLQGGTDCAGIILDASLANIDGFMTAKELRELGFTKPILLNMHLGADTKKMDNMIGEGLLHGFIMKTGDLRNLANAIGKMLRLKHTPIGCEHGDNR